jgi:hypothetical protein
MREAPASSERGDARLTCRAFHVDMTDRARRILIVANLTGSTPALLEQVRTSAREGASFMLLVPPETGDATDWTLDDACSLLGSAAGGPVTTVSPGADAALTVHQLVADGQCAEVIVSTRPEHHHRWFHHDLPQKMQDLSVRVTVIPPEAEGWGPIAGFPADWVPGAVNPAGTAGLGNY